MNKMTAKHFTLFIIGAILISSKTYSSLFISIGGRDTWISFIIAFIIFMLFAMFIVHIIDSKKPLNINSVFIDGLNKPLGNLFLLLFALGLFLNAVESASVEANCMRTNFFQDTPIWYILIFFLLPSLYIIGKKFNTLLIFIIISVSFLAFNGISILLLVEKYKNVQYLLPVLKNSLSKEVIYAALLLLGALSAFSIVLPYIKFITEKRKMKKHTAIVLLLCGFISLYSIMTVIVIFGPVRGANLFYPEASASQLVQLGGFLEFGELSFVFQTILGFFIKYILCTYGIYTIYEKHFKNNKPFVIIYTLSIFICYSIIGSNNYYLFQILKYYQIANIILLFIVPLLAFTAYNMRNKQ